jgi:hypothetical protein
MRQRTCFRSSSAASGGTPAVVVVTSMSCYRSVASSYGTRRNRSVDSNEEHRWSPAWSRDGCHVLVRSRSGVVQSFFFTLYSALYS